MSTPPPPGQKSINIADLPAECMSTEPLRKIHGVVVYPADQEANLPNLKLFHHGGTRCVDIAGVQITLGSIPQLRVCISDSQQTILIGKGSVGLWTFRMWGRSSVEIADGCTSNGTLCWLTPGAQLRIGEDCMFAESINIHVGDNHAIFDVNTLAPTNYRQAPTVVIGSHVWLATGVSVLADTTIGSGSIVAAQALLKGEVPECSLAAGIPARVIRTGVSWTRSPDGSGASEVVQRFDLKKSQRAN